MGADARTAADAGTAADVHTEGLGEATSPAAAEHAAHDTTIEWVLMFASFGLAVLGILVGMLLYLRRPEIPGRIAAGLGGVYALVRDKYRVDELYDAVIVRPLVGVSRQVLWKTVDVKVIDMLVNLVGMAAKGFSYAFRFLQTGYVQAYAFVILLGLAVILFRAF
jgi:NADH-quinone oxidoreductase subunit L